MKVAAILESDKAIALYHDAGFAELPEIVAGASVVWKHFTTSLGFEAIFVNQRPGGVVEPTMDPGITKCVALVAIDPPNQNTARHLLEKSVRELLNLPKHVP